MQHTLLNATSLIFIDAHLKEIDTLCANLPHDAEIQLLNSEENLLIQIAAQLKNRNDIAALHLITHGRSGELLLGDNGVFLETLPLYGKELLAITQAMSSEGEILIYGCEVAFGERGSAFVEMLRDITGLKIAASTHKVGSSELGGSWELDNAHVNSIVSPLVVSEFKGVLDPSPDTTAPVITSTPITTVDEGSRYNYALAATDDNTVTWSVKGGTALPSWLSLGKGESLTTLVPDFSDPGGMAYNEVTGDIYATANSFLSFMMEVATESFIWKISPNGDKALFTTSVSGQIGSMVIVGDYLYAGNLSLGSGIAGEIVRYDLSDTDGAVTPEVLLSLDSPGIYSAGALGLAAHGSFLYAVDYANSKILKIDLANLTAEPMVYLDLGLQNKSQPYGIAFDAAGNLYGTLLGAQEGGVGEVYKFDGTNF